MDKKYQKSLLLSLSYDGSNYHGWVIQKNQKTVQQVLQQSIKKLIKTTDFKVLGASKTDAGVHANDQKVLLMVNFSIKNLAAFKSALNKILPLDIRVNQLKNVSLDFNVRSVKEKVYEYLLNDGEFNLVTQRFETQFPQQKISVQQLNKILQLFVGEHDYFLFSGLSTKERELVSTIRTINSIKVQRVQGKVKITFKAKGFIRYQIRMIVGASLMCLTNPKRLNEQQIEQMLTGVGKKNLFLAPPNGLILKKIIY